MSDNHFDPIQKHWKIIENDALPKSIFPKKTFLMYKRHKNLIDVLIKVEVYNGILFYLFFDILIS